jgi:hypothetical protein
MGLAGTTASSTPGRHDGISFETVATRMTGGRMPRIGDRVRVRETGRTAVIRGVREDDRADQYAIVYDDRPGDAARRPDQPTPGEVGDAWLPADALEVVS